MITKPEEFNAYCRICGQWTGFVKLPVMIGETYRPKGNLLNVTLRACTICESVFYGGGGG